MPPTATSSTSIYAHLLTALGVELLRMTMSVASLSALDSSLHARLWLLRLSWLPMADHARVGTTYFVMVGHIWPSSFGVCTWPPSHRQKRRIQRVLRMWLRGFGGQGVLGGMLSFSASWDFAGVGRDWVGLGRGFFLGLFSWALYGAVFYFGPWCFFPSFISFLLCYWGLKSSEPWGYLWFLILLFLPFFFVDIGLFLNIEHDLALLHMSTYIAKRWHRAYGLVYGGAVRPLL